MEHPEELNEEIEQGDAEGDGEGEDEGEEEVESIVSDDVQDLKLGVGLDEEQIDDDEEDFEQEEINKEELGELNTIKSYLYKNSFTFNDDLEANDSHEFLQKFNKESKNDYIASTHQECFSKNLDEIKDLLPVIRDKNNIIIDELHKTLPILTKYEKAKILGVRIKQLNNGALPYVKIAEDLLDTFIIAEKELKEKKIPFIIQRPLPNNTFEYWKLEDLEIL
jgi:DNA-directed RNA polymerase I, II, and III subunit RPABC2